MEIKLYNSLSNRIETFKPIQEGKVSMYVCGPTVYNYIHVGNGRPVVFFDAVRRFFEACGYQVTFASNFTDIDDKIIKRAQEENMTEKEVSEKYIAAYLDVMKKLNCKPNEYNPRVTECMDDITEFIEELVANGNAYQRGDDTYFSVRSIDNYGILSNQHLDDLKAGARIDVASEKEDPSDFILWKKTGDTGIKWPSKLGEGRPGWHTECVVMIQKIFKGMIDIHGGGNDLKFPHHENEIAQSNALHRHPIAHYWLHNARVDLAGEKMSKSLGNVVWLKDVLETHQSNAFRLLILSSQYRSTINYSEELMNNFEQDVNKINKAYLSIYRKLELADGLDNDSYDEEIFNAFLEAIANDFNFANGITKMYELIKQINTSVRQNCSIAELSKMYYTLVKMLGVIGLKMDVKPLTVDERALVNKWNDARSNKDFALADQLRQEITDRGIAL